MMKLIVFLRYVKKANRGSNLEGRQKIRSGTPVGYWTHSESSQSPVPCRVMNRECDFLPCVPGMLDRYMGLGTYRTAPVASL